MCFGTLVRCLTTFCPSELLTLRGDEGTNRRLYISVAIVSSSYPFSPSLSRAPIPTQTVASLPVP